MRDSDGQLISVWEYMEDGTHVFTDHVYGGQHSWRYSVVGDVIHVGGETFDILSSTKDSLVVREGRPHEDVEPFTIRLTRIPNDLSPVTTEPAQATNRRGSGPG